MEIAGHKLNNWWLIGGGTAVVVVYEVYKHSNNNSSSSSSDTSTSASSIDPVTGLPYSEDNETDPLTGLTYLAEAQEYGSVQAAEEEVTSGSAYFGDTGDTGDVDSGYPTGLGYDDTGTTTSAQSYSTNSQWAQAVTSGLVALGYNAADVTTALGLFFAQHPLGSGSDGVSYASIIEAAEAEYGPPPQGTYSIIPEPSTSTTPPGTSTTMVKVPKVDGLSVNDGESAITNAGLVPDVTSGGPRNPSDQYVIWSQTPGAGTSVAKGSKVSLAIKQK